VSFKEGNKMKNVIKTFSSMFCKNIILTMLLLLVALYFSACEKNKEKAKTAKDETQLSSQSGEEGEAKSEGEEGAQSFEGTPSGISGAESGTEGKETPTSLTSQGKVDTQVSQEALKITEEGMELLKGGNIAGAESKFKQAVEEDSNAFVASYNLGVMYERQGNFSEAKKYYKKSFTAKPDYGPALASYALLEYKMGGSLKSALGFLEGVVKKYPSALAAHAAYAKLLAQDKQIQKAMEVAKDVLKKDERNVDAMVALARAYLQNGQNEFARFIISQAKDIDDKNPEVYLVLADIAQAMGNEKLAISYISKAVEIDPYLIEARNNLAVHLIEGGSFEEAEKHLSELARVVPTKSEIFINLGEAYRGMRKWDEAISAFGKAEQLGAPKDVLYFNLALLYFSADSVKGLSKKEILLKSQDYFIKYRNEVGPKVASSSIDLDSYLKRLDKMIKVQEKLEAKAKEKGGEGGGGETK